uniref:DUF4065 domain-containing protein n=1 Tax=Rhabditophanes sp. KR3021 TaxID=114890 RepID=A0AC35TQS4_9BILA
LTLETKPNTKEVETQYELQKWSNDQIQRIVAHDPKFKEFMKEAYQLMTHHLEESVVFFKILGSAKF